MALRTTTVQSRKAPVNVKVRVKATRKRWELSAFTSPDFSRSSSFDFSFYIGASFFPKDKYLGIYDIFRWAQLTGFLPAKAMSGVWAGRARTEIPRLTPRLTQPLTQPLTPRLTQPKNFCTTHFPFQNRSLVDFSKGKEGYGGDVGEDGCFT